MKFKQLIYFFFQLNIFAFYAQNIVHPITQNHIIADSVNFEYISNGHLFKLNTKTKSLDSISLEINQKIGTYNLIKNSDYFLINSLG